MSTPPVADRLLVERTGQLRLDLAAALKRQRREGECRACGEPTVAGWRLCERHARAMLDGERGAYAVRS